MKKKEEGDFALHCGDKPTIVGLVMLAAWLFSLGDWSTRAEPDEPTAPADQLKILVRRTRAAWFLPWSVRVIEPITLPGTPDERPYLRTIDETFCWTERGAHRVGRRMRDAERRKRARETPEREVR